MGDLQGPDLIFSGRPRVCSGIGSHSARVLACSVDSCSRVSYALAGGTVNLATREQVPSECRGIDIFLAPPPTGI